jgi:hypothetical protein
MLPERPMALQHALVEQVWVHQSLESLQPPFPQATQPQLGMQHSRTPFPRSVTVPPALLQSMSRASMSPLSSAVSVCGRLKPASAAKATHSRAERLRVMQLN